MAKYIDGFLFVVPKGKTAEYKKMAALGKRLWMKHGALAYRECKGDDLKPNMQGMPHRRFAEAAKAKQGDTVWFSYIEYKSKKHRNKVNAKVMKDPAMNDPKWKDKQMPFDMRRFCYGGFSIEIGS